MNYLTEDEMQMSEDMVDLQIALGLQSCKTKGTAVSLLKDVRMHERLKLIKEIEKLFYMGKKKTKFIYWEEWENFKKIVGGKPE